MTTKPSDIFKLKLNFLIIKHPMILIQPFTQCALQTDKDTGIIYLNGFDEKFTFLVLINN